VIVSVSSFKMPPPNALVALLPKKVLLLMVRLPKLSMPPPLGALLREKALFVIVSVPW